MEESWRASSGEAAFSERRDCGTALREALAAGNMSSDPPLKFTL